MKILFKVIKYTLVIILIIPILFLGQCIFINIYQERAIKTLCEDVKEGMALDMFLTAAKNTNFKIRTGGIKGKSEGEWFDREYLRYGNSLRKYKNIIDDYTVVFAKPGIGFYACIVIHKNNIVTAAWFEDHAE